MNTSFSIRAHAKINLSLRVLGRRPDGYHDLETVFQALMLHDTLDFEVRAGPFALACDTGGVPLDDRNLVWQAARSVWNRAGRGGDPAGALVRLRKRIPMQGGLGGGSSNAAAALVAFASLWLPDAEADPATLGHMAAAIGADVRFFLCGGTALGLDRGDRVLPLADVEPRHVVLVFPPFGVSTPAAYGWLDEARAGGRADLQAGGGVSMPGGVHLAVHNELEPPVAARHPEIGQARDALLASGAEAAAMSGSGSTVFGLFRERGQAARAAGALRGNGWRTLLTRTASRRQSSPARWSLSGRGPLV